MLNIKQKCGTCKQKYFSPCENDKYLAENSFSKDTQSFLIDSTNKTLSEKSQLKFNIGNAKSSNDIEPKMKGQIALTKILMRQKGLTPDKVAISNGTLTMAGVTPSAQDNDVKKNNGFRFAEVQSFYENYSMCVAPNSEIIIKENSTGRTVDDKETIIKCQFAHLWNNAAAAKAKNYSPISYWRNTPNAYSFNEGAHETYSYIMNNTIKQFNNFDNLALPGYDGVVAGNFPNLPQYKYADEILYELFTDEKSMNIVKNYVGLATEKLGYHEGQYPAATTDIGKEGQHYPITTADIGKATISIPAALKKIVEETKNKVMEFISPNKEKEDDNRDNK